MHLRRGDLVMVRLGPAVTHEQAGLRPAVVVSNDVGNRHAPIVVVVPLSRRPPRLPTHVAIRHPALQHVSTALAEQLRVVDKARVLARLGRLEGEQMARVDEAVAVALSLAPRVHAAPA